MNLTLNYKVNHQCKEWTRVRLLSLLELKSFYIVKPSSNKSYAYKIYPARNDLSNYSDRLQWFGIDHNTVNQLGKRCVICDYQYLDIARVHVKGELLTVNSLLLAPR